MKISTKGRYSLLMLLDLAENKEQGFVSLKDIARRKGISKKYLEQIVSLLNGAGLLRANRGNQGGYMLAKNPNQYKVGQILRITEGSFAPVSCVEAQPNQCERACYCKTLFLWEELKTVIDNYLDGVTLQTILDRNNANGGCEYFI